MEEKLQSFIFGKNPVLEAVSAGNSIEKILISTTGEKQFEHELRAAIKDRSIELQFVPKERLNRYTHANHQGVIAIVNHYQYASFDEMIYEPKENLLLLILDQITDVRNFGGIARSALIGGCDGIIIPAHHSVNVTEDAMKASAGALAKIKVAKVNVLNDCADALANAGVNIFASSMQGKTMLQEINFNDPCAVVLGSEKSGVSKGLLSRADSLFRIPQNNLLDSYNVSVSAGIIFYQIYLSRNS